MPTSIVRNPLAFQYRKFLRKPLHLYPTIPKSFRSNIPDFVEEYIQCGKTASRNPSKSLLNLEDLIKSYDKSEIYAKLLSSKEYRSYGIKNQFFIALALPSMTGKTQMAFNIRSKRPLYFALHYNQPINKLFCPTSLILKNLLESDFDDAQNIIISKLNNKVISDEKITFKEVTEVITLDFLDAYLRHHKFKSLGCLVSLVRECEKLYTESKNDEWMKFYAENQKLLKYLEYEPISLNEFEAQEDVYEPPLEKYFFFIDEFYSEPGIIMLRNMCRYLRIPCVLASTNTEIVNITGVNTNTGSGTCPPYVFCAVFQNLSTLSHEEIEKFFNEKINCESFLELARNVSETEERRMSLLLQFFKNQAKSES